MGPFALPWSRQKLISALMTVATSRRPAKQVAGVFGWKCRGVCVCPSPGREVLIGPAHAAVRVQGSFQL